MKRLITCTIIFLALLSVNAQSRWGFNYQCVVRDASKALVKNKNVQITFIIVRDSISGTIVYTETQTAKTDNNGFLSLQIGNDSSKLLAIDWSARSYFLNTSINTGNGEITSGSRLLSVPYSLYAVKADSSEYLADFGVSATGDTLKIGKIKVIVPGISSANHPALTDKDGNTYKTILLGKKFWMAENLRTSKYNDGNAIPDVSDKTAWVNLSLDTDPKWTLTGGYCWYSNDQAKDKVYGKLYNFGAVETGKLCPTGWHVPSLTDWKELLDTYRPKFLAESELYGYELMEKGVTHWTNGTGTNQTGFTAVPGGYRNEDGTFSEIGLQCYFWSSDGNGTNLKGIAWPYPVPVDFSFGKTPSSMRRSVRNGYSVRCVKD
jgi:uncharacterized protein (TIGR02145 family)